MIDVEVLRPGDHAAVIDLGRMAFGSTESHDPTAPTVDEDRHACVYEGDRVIAAARTHAFAQWFGGRAVPCGGLSAVMVATDRRGAGLGRAVVGESLQRMRERGEVITSLYPTTAALYHSLGYAVAGSYFVNRLPLVDLPPSDDSVVWEPSRYDATEVRSVGNRAGEHHDGWVVRPDVDWEWAEHQRVHGSVTADVFVGLRDDRPVAVCSVDYDESSESVFALRSETTLGVDAHAMGEALAFLGRHGMSSRDMVVKLPPHVLDAQLTHPQRVRPVNRLPVMTRIVDVQGAFSARGWNTAADVVLDLEIHDALLDGNAGRWRVRVVDGRAVAEPGGDGTAQIDIADLSSWFTGYTSANDLATRGLIAGAEPEELHALDLPTAGAHPPTCVDFF